MPDPLSNIKTEKEFSGKNRPKIRLLITILPTMYYGISG
jgi:hypothetical protein